MTMILKAIPVFILILICSTTYTQGIDYTNIENWAAHKEKKDMADSVPKPLLGNTTSIKTANVFFIHPTTYTEPNAYLKRWNADITDIGLNKKTDESTILFQASCFNEQCEVFAPRYRQAHIQAFYTNSDMGKAALDTAYNDIKKAFEVFLEVNKKMPIIIASHSQGTVHAGRLIKDYFENKPLMQQLVAAYLIGMPVSKSYFKDCKPCAESNQTNCFVSWRTFLKGHQENYMKLENENSIVVTNPLNWRMDTSFVSRSNNKGSVILKFNKLFKKVNGAEVHNNILWIDKPKFPFSFLAKSKMTNFHIGDINLFYVNIRENVKERLFSFLQK